MAYESFIGMRYLMSQRRNDVLSVITVISVMGVSLGVAAMIVVLSVMGGFEGDLKTKILGTKTHITVTGENDDFMRGGERLADEVMKVEGITGASPYLESEVMISSPTNLSGVVIKGIDPVRVKTVSDLERNLVDGDLGYLQAASKVRPGRRGLSDPDELDRILDELEGEMGLDGGKKGDGGVRIPGIEGKVYQGKDGRPVIDQGATSDDFRRKFIASPDEPIGLKSDSATLKTPYNPDDVGELYPDELPEGYIPPLPGQATPSAAKPPGGDKPYNPDDVGELYPDELPEGYIPPLPGQEEIKEKGDEMPAIIPMLPVRRDVPGIIIGRELKKSLQVDIGSEVNLVSPQGDIGPSGPMPKSRPYKIVGVFYSGMYEYDTKYVYMSIPSAQGFLNLEKDQVSGIEIKTGDVDKVKAYKDSVAAMIARDVESQELIVQDWEDMNKSLFAALRLEKIVMGIILGIIILVASFSIVCNLVMVVIEKAREIAVIKSMGATNGGVMRIFIFEGTVIGLLGTTIGIILGVGLCLIIEFYGIQLDPDVYYISNLPVEMDLNEILQIAVSGILISVGATLYPAAQASKLNPVDGLRYD